MNDFIKLVNKSWFERIVKGWLWYVLVLILTCLDYTKVNHDDYNVIFIFVTLYWFELGLCWVITYALETLFYGVLKLLNKYTTGTASELYDYFMEKYTK